MMDKRISPLRITAEDLDAYGSNLGSLFGVKKHRLGSGSAVLEGPILSGRFEAHAPRRGISLFVVDLALQHPIELSIEMAQPVVGFSLVLSGSCTYNVPRLTGRESVVEFKSGTNVIGTYQAEKSYFDLAGGETHRMVELQIDPAEARRLVESSETTAAHPLHPIIMHGESSRSSVQTTLPPSLEDIAHQIMRCPLEGAARRLFMESKALEILALELDTFSRQRPLSDDGRSTQDLERLEQARVILEGEFDDPPSLVELARRVGLNDFKLKRGFRQFYNTTVFGYVRRLRMEKARALLETGDLNVTEVAMATGYNCFGHFSAAFKKHFGLLPRDFRRARTHHHTLQATP